MLRVNIVVALVVVGHCCGMHVKCWRQLLFCLHVECSDVCVLVSQYSFWLMLAGVGMSVHIDELSAADEPTAVIHEPGADDMALPLAESPRAMQLFTPPRPLLGIPAPLSSPRSSLSSVYNYT